MKNIFRFVRCCGFLFAVFCLFTTTNPLNAQWSQTNGPLTEVTYSLAVGINNAGDSILYAGTYRGGVFLSTNYGDNWVEIDGGNFSTGDTGFTRRDIRVLAANNDGKGGIALYAGTGYGVFLTTNNGVNWTAVDSLVGYRNFVISHTSAGDTILFKLDGSGGILHSTDDGAQWSKVNGLPSYFNVTCLAVHDTIVYAGTSNYGLYYSLNSGLSWNPGSLGLNATSVNALAVCGSYLFTGLDHPFILSSIVYRRPLSEMLTGVEDRDEHKPSYFTLEQNYPNPFNPSTEISFALPSNGFVTLKLYDLLGKEVATLVAGVTSAGHHSVRWDASSFASGIYFYRLQTEKNSETKKLILLR
jgi:hypothetical protein